MGHLASYDGRHTDAQGPEKFTLLRGASERLEEPGILDHRHQKDRDNKGRAGPRCGQVTTGRGPVTSIAPAISRNRARPS
jgi:hypothetical protein